MNEYEKVSRFFLVVVALLEYINLIYQNIITSSMSFVTGNILVCSFTVHLALMRKQFYVNKKIFGKKFSQYQTNQNNENIYLINSSISVT